MIGVFGTSNHASKLFPSILSLIKFSHEVSFRAFIIIFHLKSRFL